MSRPVCLTALVYCFVLVILLHLEPISYEDFSDYNKDIVTVQGEVEAKEYTTKEDGSIQLLVTLKNCSLEGWEENPQGKIRCRLGDGTKENAKELDSLLKIGGQSQIKGTLYCDARATNDGEFDYLLYDQIMGYASFQVYSSTFLAAGESYDPLRNALYLVKRHFADVLDASLSEEDASILKAMLLGEKGSLSDEIQDLYQNSGIIHILAISGLHISVIGMGLFRILRKLHVPLPVSCAAAVALMLLYGGMTGMSASSFRAIFMFMMHMAALCLHRTYDLLTSVSLAGMLLLLEQPYYLYYSGFLFSFSAVLSIALLAPSFSSRGMKALSVTFGTLPVYLVCYGTFPVFSVILNLFILPLLSTVMVSGIAVLLAGSIFPFAGKIMGMIPHVILLFYRALCEWTGNLAFHSVNLGAPSMIAVFLYVGILVLIVAGSNRLNAFCKVHVPSFSFLPELFRILACTAAVLILCVRFSSGLFLHIIDVGQGDGILIRSSDAVILIDGGSTSKSDVAEYQLTPLFQHYGVRKLDYVMITHPDEDHMNGALEVIRGSKTHREGIEGFLLDDSKNGMVIGALCLPSIAIEAQNETYASLVEAASEKNIPVFYFSEGDQLEGEKLSLLCLHPAENSNTQETNELSIVLYLQYGNFTALLTGDLEGEGEEQLIDYVASSDEFADSSIPLTLLKVAHHGSREATSEEFLSTFSPELAVISCGMDNSYGHPHEETLERLKEAGVSTIYDTRTDGEITFHTDGETLKITKHN